MIYLTANDTNLGEQMDLLVVADRLGPGQLFFLDDAVRHSEYRRQVLKAIRGEIPVVAGGGTMSRFFEPFWNAIALEQRFLFVGTGVCWPHGTDEAFPLHPRHIDPRSAFRGPVDPLGSPEPSFIPPPGILFGIQRTPPSHVLSVFHRQLVDSGAQHSFAAAVGRSLGLPVIGSDHRTEDADLYSGAALVITSRLHGAVMAAGNGIPCVALSGDRKMDWFCEEVEILRINFSHTAGLQATPETIRAALSAGPARIERPLDRLESYLSTLSESWKFPAS